MIPHNRLHMPSIFSPVFLKPPRSYGITASYATIRGLRQPLPKSPDVDEIDPSDNDFILSILRANPSLRDTKSYLASFGHREPERAKSSDLPDIATILPPVDRRENELPKIAAEPLKTSHVISSILNPIYRRTALVKLQGPFTDKQLDSIARGMVYLEKLGLVSVMVIEHDKLARGDEGERATIIEETMRVVGVLEAHGAKARPVLGTVVRLGPMPCGHQDSTSHDVPSPEAHVFPPDLVPIRSSLRAGEIPVLPPFALDSFCRSVRIDANDVIAALVRGMVQAAELDGSLQGRQPRDPHADYSEDINLIPLRLMIINREGGVPSYARSGYPHLLINLSSEYDFIRDTFEPSWLKERPSALSNLALARMCLSYMPPTSSAIMVSHRSPSSLIANLVTNKPAVSSSLPHALLQGNRKLTPETPTLIRRGQPIQVIRNLANVNRKKLTHLLETSFGRTLDVAPFYTRLEKYLDFVIVAGDYVGAAIVTNEPGPGQGFPPISYLDKFAVLPSHQGDGTVDFLWVALHDETYGLGHPFSVNPNGGKQGKGEGRDLVWRSRADNKINKWYFDRSSGHIRLGSWVLFWCDAEKRLKREESQRADSGLSYVESWEAERLEQWADVVTKLPSAWK
ncbi:mitochondrial amino-acid acetyltransferase [Pisolithus orientalis]|uniref:mitochondrial amino-acid acetyltransferase n=1 Tax=Pisolithus orientalis TaxID=936130 RepID=UPI00222419E4|nr:mitochondrial amino-acid acetyltransferase [Pisolithus orientalis]KAI6008301.1 mitochondrial amino-acid acetyltransferase [Pisolithus orientalis]